MFIKQIPTIKRHNMEPFENLSKKDNELFLKFPAYISLLGADK